MILDKDSHYLFKTKHKKNFILGYTLSGNYIYPINKEKVVNANAVTKAKLFKPVLIKLESKIDDNSVIEVLKPHFIKIGCTYIPLEAAQRLARKLLKL